MHAWHHACMNVPYIFAGTHISASRASSLSLRARKLLLMYYKYNSCLYLKWASLKSMILHRKTLKIYCVRWTTSNKHWKSININKFQWKDHKIHENQHSCEEKSVKIKGNQRKRKNDLNNKTKETREKLKGNRRETWGNQWETCESRKKT